MAKLSRTQAAMALVDQGVAPAVAAKEAGVTPTAVFRAIARAKGKTTCPTCNQVVRDGFVLAPPPPVIAEPEPIPVPVVTLTAAAAGAALREMVKAGDAEAKRIILDLTRYI